MQLVDDWRRVLRHAWSLRLIALAFVLSALDGVLSLGGEILQLPFWLHAGIVVATPIVDLAAFFSRLTAQKELK